ncbi:MAG: hypothetical protein Q4C53_03045 [Clostridia bacterium]|nr:hypothetical protein [Clostridia bacterium]
MKRTNVSIGIGTSSLLLVLTVLSLSLLTVLTALSTHNDAVLTDRSITIAQADLGLYAAAENTRAALSGEANKAHKSGETAEEMLERIQNALPAGAETENGKIVFTAGEGKRRLSVRLAVTDEDGMWRFAYETRRLLTETEDELWN